MDQVGADSYASKLTLAAKKDAGPGKSEMMRSLDQPDPLHRHRADPHRRSVCSTTSSSIRTLGLRQSVVSTVAALIGMIPEGLFLLTSVALAVSVVRLAQNRTLIHEMNAIETLARVDVLCVDKTGTVTSPQMQVREVVPLDPESCSETDITDILGAFYRVLDPDNDTAKAIADKFPTGARLAGPGSRALHLRHQVERREFPGPGGLCGGRTGVYPGAGLRRPGKAYCPLRRPGLPGTAAGPVRRGGDRAPPRRGDPPGPAGAGESHPPQRSQSLRLLPHPGRGCEGHLRRQPGDRLRCGGPGRHRGTQSSGWTPGSSRRIKTSPRAVREYTVFGRVVPNQKRKIVRALQSQGHTVAMTGDGVNDVLALKDADCGVAMASGADAACQVAQLVLLDSDFAAMPKVVAEGRRVINNIQRASALYLVKNILSFFLALITLFAAFPYPFVPIQLTLISALTIGVPSFFLALEPNHDLVKGQVPPQCAAAGFSRRSHSHLRHPLCGAVRLHLRPDAGQSSPPSA